MAKKRQCSIGVQPVSAARRNALKRQVGEASRFALFRIEQTETVRLRRTIDPLNGLPSVHVQSSNLAADQCARAPPTAALFLSP